TLSHAPTHFPLPLPVSHFIPSPRAFALVQNQNEIFYPPRRRAVSVSFLTLVTQSPSGTQKLQNTPLSKQKRPFYRHPKKNLQAHCSITLANVNYSIKEKKQIPSFSVPRPLPPAAAFGPGTDRTDSHIPRHRTPQGTSRSPRRPSLSSSPPYP
ncbi:hypothetical protein CMEL01_07917, partial [Colletotrichum melonis]